MSFLEPELSEKGSSRHAKKGHHQLLPRLPAKSWNLRFEKSTHSCHYCKQFLIHILNTGLSTQSHSEITHSATVFLIFSKLELSCLDSVHTPIKWPFYMSFDASSEQNASISIDVIKRKQVAWMEGGKNVEKSIKTLSFRWN